MLSNFVQFIIGTAIVALLCLALFFGLSHIQEGVQEHTHDSIKSGDKVCIEGGGYFPQDIPGPSPFLVCGIINSFDPEEKTVPAPPEYPEGDHNLNQSGA